MDYRVSWSQEAKSGTFDVPASDVEGMDESDRNAYFQTCVDEEVRCNGSSGFVDEVKELGDEPKKRKRRKRS
ncbi:MAG: hypothetical protein WC455_18035 [Dehalococcoidia bacterium]|jgi:hypothetical protein